MDPERLIARASPPSAPPPEVGLARALPALKRARTVARLQAAAVAAACVGLVLVMVRPVGGPQPAYVPEPPQEAVEVLGDYARVSMCLLVAARESLASQTERPGSMAARFLEGGI